MNWIFHIGIAQGFFAAFLLFTKRERRLPDKILGVWMIFIAMEMLHMWLEITGSHWHAITSNFGFYSITFGPFLYLYVSKLTDENASFRTADLLHFVPYTIYSLLHIIFFFNRPLLSNNIETDPGWFVLTMLRVVTLIISLSVYSVLVLRRIKKHRKSMKEQFSFQSSTITLGWLQHVTAIFIVTYLVLIINMLAGNIVQMLLHTSHLIPAIGLTFFCFSLSYFGFNQPVIFMSGERDAGSIESGNAVVLEARQRQEYLKKLLKYMDDEKPYLNAELSIQQLADGMKLPKFYLTEIFKKELQKNFFTLINDYRVEEVKKRLVSDAQKPVLQLALESGFNSKSSFNAIFRQYTGLTPTEYRRQHQIKN